MPLSDKEKEDLNHEKRKREIANTFSETIHDDALEEGVAEWIIAFIEGAILAIIALLMVPEPSISKLAAILIAVGVSILAIVGVIYVIIRSKDLLIEAKRVRDRDEDSEDTRHKEVLSGLP